MSEETPKKIKAPILSSEQLAQAVLSTKEALDRQPKRKIRIRKDPNPKAPNYETCQVNGYTYTIMKGVDVEVPQTVYEILSEAGII